MDSRAEGDKREKWENVPRGWRLWIVLLFGGTYSVASVVFAGAFFVLPLARGLSSVSWKAARGTVFREGESPRYAYEVENYRYVADRCSYDQRFETCTVEDFSTPSGDIRVFYNPENPREAVLRRGFRSSLEVVFYILMTAGLGVYFAYLTLRIAYCTGLFGSYGASPDEGPSTVAIRTLLGALSGRANDLTPLDEWTPELAADDLGWLKGAIEVDLAGTRIMGPGQWDLVYCLWVMLVERLDDFWSTGSITVGFMEQPLEFKCQELAPGKVQVSCGRRQAVADRSAFFRALLDEGKHFFRLLHEHELIPKHELQTAIERIAEFEQRMGGGDAVR